MVGQIAELLGFLVLCSIGLFTCILPLARHAIKRDQENKTKALKNARPEVGVYQVYDGSFVIKHENTGHLLVKRRAVLFSISDYYDIKFYEVRGESYSDYLTFCDRGSSGIKYPTFVSAIEVAKQVETELIRLWDEENEKKAARLKAEEQAKIEATFVPKKVWRV